MRLLPTPREAPAIEGVDLAGQPERVELTGGRTVLVFLTSSCRPCQPVWRALAVTPTGTPGPVAVTPDPATEDVRRLARLAPEGARVVMSTRAWLDYVAGPAPWAVVVVDGRVEAEGAAPTEPAGLGALLGPGRTVS